MNKYFLVMVLISAALSPAYGGGEANSKKNPKNRTEQGKQPEAEITASGSALLPLELADPHIFLDGGTYYLYGTGGKDGFWVYTSDDLVKWHGPAGASGGYALVKGDSFGDRGFWAPQVFKRDGRYHIVYTANEQIAIAHSDSPLGPFRQDQIGKISGEDRQIDPFICFDGDKAWFYHVRLQEGNKLFVAEMESDLSDIRPETAKLCFDAEPGTWEDTQNVEWRVSEGPTVFKRGGRYYFIYSANDFRNPDYAVGYAVSDSPAGEWVKHSSNPVLDKTMIGRNGTGHGDIFTDKDGNLKYVFHYHASDSRVSPRRTAIIDVGFVSDGNGGEVMRFDPESVAYLNISE